MSIGTVIADCDTFRVVDSQYHILTPEYEIGGMYESELFADHTFLPVICSRQEALAQITATFDRYHIAGIYAYNATFDRNHLPELRGYAWYDIIRLAAYRQYNPKIPSCADCFSTGRMKRNYGVEPMLRLLSNNCTYHETHNALTDAMDELEIMRLLNYNPCQYIKL